MTITNCDSEPVQTPGCLQSRGALVVARRSDLVVVQASESCMRWLGTGLDRALGADVAQILGAGAAERLRAHLTAEPADDNPLYVLTLDARGDGPALDVSMHTHGPLALIELEPTSQPGPAQAHDPLLMVTTSVARLQSTGGLLDFCQVVAEEVRRLTGLDRAMIYRFHEDGHGEVFAEAKREDLGSWLGLHYPLTNPETGQPLPMTHCALRGPSIMYTEYLQNMGVRAALTLSIRRGDQLWGLIACHHYAGPLALSIHVRAACELFAQVVSLQHQAAEDREQLGYRLHLERAHRELITLTARSGDLATLTDHAPGLLGGIDASGAALYHRGQWHTVGRTRRRRSSRRSASGSIGRTTVRPRRRCTPPIRWRVTMHRPPR